MASTDVSSLAPAVSGIVIEGPGGVAPTGRVELSEETLTSVLPGEIDAAVGSQPQPEPDDETQDDDEDDELLEDGPEDEDEEDGEFVDLDEAANALTNRVADIIEEAHPGTFGDERLPEARKATDALFDPQAYDATPVLDGQATDELVIAFSGSVKFAAGDEDGRTLFESLRLGKLVDLNVGGFVSGKAGAYKENAEGESTVTGKATVKVTDLRVLRPEDLT